MNYRKITLLTIDVLLFLAVIESCARLSDFLKWRADFSGNYSSERLVAWDRLGMHNRFNARFEKWRINGAGFRGAEVEPAKPSGVSRVLVLGASETFGLYERENGEYPARLGALLASARPGRYQVLNAASPGMTPPRAAQTYRSWFVRFSPDYVLYYPSPSLYLEDVAPHAVDVARLRERPPGFQFRVLRSVKNVLKPRLPQAVKLAALKLDIARGLRSHPQGWIWREPPPDRLAQFRSDLVALVAEVRRSGARPVLVTHAHRFGERLSAEDYFHLVNWRRFFPRAEERCLLAMEAEANRVIGEIGAAYGVPVVALDRVMPKDGVHFADFAHFTDAGAEVAAGVLADALLALDAAGVDAPREVAR